MVCGAPGQGTYHYDVGKRDKHRGGMRGARQGAYHYVTTGPSRNVINTNKSPVFEL
jgi:hypothetical protein